jgi:hypothetical protein
MLMPNNVTPDKSLYFLGGIVLEIIKKKSMNIDDLYIEILKKKDISYQLLVLTLDWLFVINAIVISTDGEIKCI